VQALGAKIHIATVIGNDSAGERLQDLFRASSMGDSAFLYEEGRITTIKTRIIRDNEHMLRVDEETDTAISNQTAKKLIEACLKIMNNSKIDVVIFEDYDKGVLTTEIIKSLTDEAKKRGIPVTVDPKLRGFFNYPGVDLFKPNIQELREGLQRDIDLPMGLPDALNELHNKLSPKISITTLGSHGMWIHCPEGENTEETSHLHIKSRPSNVIDVSGAGDTVIATASLMLAAGATPLQIAEVANIAAGQVCEHSGVVTVDLEQLIAEV
jgi:rfaE bifunctional protein kinase chain/domain